MLLWYYFTVNTDVAYRTIHYCFHTSKFHRKYASWSPRTNSCTRKVYTMCFTTAWFFRNGSKRDLPATTPSLGPPQEELWLCLLTCISHWDIGKCDTVTSGRSLRPALLEAQGLALSLHKPPAVWGKPSSSQDTRWPDPHLWTLATPHLPS